MSALVIDASVLFKLLVAEPDTPQAFALAESHQLNVPDLVFAEIGNGLWARVRSGKSRAEDVSELLSVLDGYDFNVHPVRRHIERALTIANTLGHPVYDCIYLAMAESLSIPLVTADGRFLDALRRNDYRAAQVTALAEVAI